MMLTFSKTPGGLLAAIDPSTEKFVRELHEFEAVVFEPWFGRDMFEHRKIFAQIAELAKAIGTSPDCLRAELLIETGNFHLIGELFGRTVVAVSSMSRHSMKDHELHAFWDEAKEIIRTKMLARIADATTREQLARSLSLQRA